MKRLKHNFKKGMACVLSLCLIAGLVPAMSGKADTVRAATGSGTEPSVTAFATKTELMNAFTPDSDGNAPTAGKGKLVFGKNSSGSAQEWYILGKDTGVSGDNTILFAASPIATNQVFENDYSNNKDFDTSFGVYTSNPTDVYPNHYGASDLRGALQGMLKDTDGNTVTTYFTEAEQGIMNDTTVTTNDTKNGVSYTTTDKLYALQGDYYNYTKLWAGSNNQTVLAMSSYWNSGSWFWLRSPYGRSDNYALLAIPGDYVNRDNVDDGDAVQPASNLNLSSVIFASAARAASSDKAASGTIADGMAMTLRLDGKNKTALTNAGLKYNHGKITYTAGSDITLVVQGRGSVNGEVKDWYYSVTGGDSAKEISASDIKSGLSLGYTPNLNDCKIWVELTDTDGLTYAVMGEDSKGSVTAFATPDELMYSFTPDSDGNATTFGKLAFGKKSDGTTAQEWYILGKDDGVSGDNTILFAASPIATSQKFNSSTSSKTYSYNAGTGYGDSAGSTEVYANHYGASDLCGALQRMLKDTNGNTVTTYFTAAEQGMMNDTTVTTKDTKNNVSYTTTDKLYALQGDYNYNYDKKLWAGSKNQTVLAMDSYWNSGSWFWLRSPNDGSGSSALLAFPGLYVYYDDGYDDSAVQPASNLNLSSVIFASAAKAASSDTASGTITDGTAMTLRLDDTNKAIGTVVYDAENGKIAAQKDENATGTVSLVVQGKDGTSDWYYSVPVGGTTVVSASQIKEEITSLSKAPDLADCNIWLETTIDNVAYARMAEKTTETINVVAVDSVAVTGMKPVGGNEFSTTVSCNTTGIATTTPAITYTTEVGGSDEPVTGNADWNTTYKAAVNLSTGIIDNKVYVFGNSVSVTVDSETQSDSITPNADGTLTITREFTTAKRKIGSVTAPAVPGNNTFTTYYGYDGYNESPIVGSNTELGSQATVTFTDSVNPNEEAMDVTWTVANDADGGYNNAPGAENTFRWTISAAALTNYDADGCANYDSSAGTITGTVTIKNKAATPVTITGTDSSVAYTGGTIDVSNYFNIDSNAGTAKVSLVTGEDGGTGEGSLNGSFLTVTKTGTFKIKVETIANGIYASGEGNITLTVENGTIQYTASDYSVTYDGQPHSISVNVTNPEGTTITYSEDGNIYGSDNPSFTDAGTYTVYYRITKDNYDTIEASKTVTIDKKFVTITAENQDIVWGNAIDQSKYTVSKDGLVTGDSIAEITLAPDTAALTENGIITVSGVKIKNTAGNDMTGNYGITTVKGALKITAAPVTAVAITGIETPAANTTLDTSALCATTGVSSTTPQITWTPNDSTAGYNTSYTASITLTAATGHEFADDVTATVLGNTAASVTKNDDGTLTVTYAFSATAKDKLTGITAPQAITVANGTAYDAMNLPATVSIVTEGKTVTSAAVTWDTTTPASGSYDLSVLTEQTVTLNGTVTCPDTIDTNGVPLTTTITITISAAGSVGVPTANPAAGTYSENQSVALTSSTEGTEIYYTTDGSEPTLSGGAPVGSTQQYIEPISVTGTAGQSVETTIKAIAVKSGMQDSSAGTFTYTIQIPVTEYTITATAGANGTVSPNGAVRVAEGGSQTFTISPSSGYAIDALKVDGLEVTAATSYTFRDVNADHTIEVTFKRKSQTPTPTPTLTPTPTSTPTPTPTPTSTSTPTPTSTLTPTPTPTPMPTPTSTPTPTLTPMPTPTPTPTSTSTSTPTPTPAKKPQGTVTPEETRENSKKLDSGISTDFDGNKFNLSWEEVDGAEGYDIFAATCGKTKLDAKSLIKTVKGKKTSASLAKIAGRKISGKSVYKVKIKAWRYVDGKKVYIGSSRAYHVAGKANKKYTNAKKLKPWKKKYVLKKGESTRIKVTVVKQSKKKKLLPKSHGPALRYASSDKTIATVTKNGKVKAKKKGTCYITVTALNGVKARIKITVK